MSALASKADVSFYEHTSEFERTSPISQLRTWRPIAGNRPVSMLGTLVTIRVPDRIVTSRSGDPRRRGIGVLHGVAGKLAALGRRRDGDPRGPGGAGSHPRS